MQPWKNYWRINPGLTILMSSVLVILVMIDRWIEYEYTLIPQEKMRQEIAFRGSTTRMWQTVSDLMLADNRVATETYLTSYSSDFGFESVALILNRQILLSNKFAQRGGSAKDISCYHSTWVNQATSGLKPIIEAHPLRSNQICAVIPIALKERTASLRPENLAVLVVQYDMTPGIMSLKQQIWRPEQLLRYLGFALIAAFLITLIMRRFVINPLQNIRLRMEEYGSGDMLARVQLEGSCELVDVANNFNKLAEQVNASDAKIRESEDRWVKALDAAGDGVWDWNLKNDTVFFSNQWKRILGYQADEVGDSIDEWTSRVHPDDLPHAQESIKKHIDGVTDVYRSTYRMRCKDGRYKWFFDRGMVFERSPSGEALRLTGVHSDISEQKQVEEALKNSQQQFELAMLGSNDGLWDWRLADNSVYYSPRWKMMLGYHDDELENDFSIWEKLVHPDDLNKAKEELALCITGKKDLYEVEFRLLHKAQHWVSVLSRAIVVKDADNHVSRIVGTHMDLTEIRAMQKELEESRQQLKKMAFYDVLTGLPNRRLLEDCMNDLLVHNRRAGNILAVAMMDLDGFKQVNDTYGHDVGDELLKSVSERLTLSMRAEDTIARLGGDEFVLLFTGLLKPESVLEGLERVVHTIGQPYFIDGNECRVTASIGVAFFPQDGETGDTLLRYADLAMYRSKQAGRNQFSIYEAYMSDFDSEHSD